MSFVILSVRPIFLNAERILLKSMTKTHICVALDNTNRKKMNYFSSRVVHTEYDNGLLISDSTTTKRQDYKYLDS